MDATQCEATPLPIQNATHPPTEGTRTSARHHKCLKATHCDDRKLKEEREYLNDGTH